VWPCLSKQALDPRVKARIRFSSAPGGFGLGSFCDGAGFSRQDRISLLFEQEREQEFQLDSSSFNFASIFCVWIVAGTRPGYILESLDQKTQVF
jgi:hypothetical protein